MQTRRVAEYVVSNNDRNDSNLKYGLTHAAQNMVQELSQSARTNNLELHMHAMISSYGTLNIADIYALWQGIDVDEHECYCHHELEEDTSSKWQVFNGVEYRTDG